MLIGQISDSMCGASHQSMAHGHGGTKVNARECTLECVKAGPKYVLVSKGKIYSITNQDFAGLKTHAGHKVEITGEVGSDGKSITVANIEMLGAKTSKG